MILNRVVARVHPNDFKQNPISGKNGKAIPDK
jgi:hypothetical protein